MKYLNKISQILQHMRGSEISDLYDGRDMHTTFVTEGTLISMEDELAEALRILSNPPAKPKVLGLLCPTHMAPVSLERAPEVLECPVCLKAKLEEMGRRIEEAHDQGLREGITRYAHWKNGVQLVGTCGTTLADALQHRNCP